MDRHAEERFFVQHHVNLTVDANFGAAAVAVSKAGKLSLDDRKGTGGGERCKKYRKVWAAITHKSRLDRCSQNLSQNDDRCLMRNTLVLSVRGSLPPGTPGEPPPPTPPQPPPPTTADADAGPLAASHMPDTEAEAVMPSAPNLNTVPPPAEDPRRRGPSAEAGGDEMVGDSIGGMWRRWWSPTGVVYDTAVAVVTTTSTGNGGAMGEFRLYAAALTVGGARKTRTRANNGRIGTRTRTRT